MWGVLKKTRYRFSLIRAVSYLNKDICEAECVMSDKKRASYSKVLTKNIFKYAALSAVLVAVLVFLIVQSSKNFSDERRKVDNALSELKEQDAVWDVEVYEAETAKSASYDDLFVQSTVVQENLKVVEALNKQYLIASAEIAALKASVDGKQALIEKFKAQHSLYRNSLAYLPIAVRDVRFLAQEKTNKNIDAAAQSILLLTLDYVINSNSEKADVIKGLVSDVSNMDILDEGLDEARRTLVIHAYAVLRKDSEESLSLSDLKVFKLRVAIDNVHAKFAQYFDDKADNVATYKNLLALFSVILLVALAILVYQLVRSFSKISEANETLEINVAARTANLNDALVQLKTQQGQLVQQEKMASLGQMVAGIAHEINTPLGYLRSGLQSSQGSVPIFQQLTQAASEVIKGLTSEAPNEEELEHHLIELNDIVNMVNEEYIVSELDELLKNGIFGVDQISDIVANLKSFSRLDSSDSASEYDMGDCIKSTLKIATNVIKEVQVKQELEKTPILYGFPSQINQVLLNLITNACHATEGKSERLVEIKQTLTPNNEVRVDVIDNGTGMSAEVVEKVFDPFFTTKKVGSGTGLGLHISRQIVTTHKGQPILLSPPKLSLKRSQNWLWQQQTLR